MRRVQDFDILTYSDKKNATRSFERKQILLDSMTVLGY